MPPHPASHLAFTCLYLLFPANTHTTAFRITPAAGATVLDGEAPHVRIAGLRPGETVTVHAFRLATVYPTVRDQAGETVLAHAEATVRADSKGDIALDTVAPISGTYSGADPEGLLWSGTRVPLAGDPAQPITQGLHLNGTNEIVLRVQTASPGGSGWGESSFHLSDGADTVEVQEVALPGLNGAFARPRTSSRPLRAILLLHGSEGGSKASARATAIRFAHLGYAAFAVNYFAWPYAGVPGVPQALVNIPVETLASARTWLQAQPGVDARKVALWGVSKGAELALVGAAHYDWVNRVVACVPSSVVWQGFGRPPVEGEVYSSWSLGGKGLPYISYDQYQDVLDDKFSAAFVHERSLNKASAEQRDLARIPIERSHAEVLLLAATNDVVWPSGTMAKQIEVSVQHGRTVPIVKSLIFPDASHYICGTGSEPRRINPVHKPEGNDPSPEADAHANASGWKATQAFLAR